MNHIYEGKRVLVTGAAGTIGTVMVDILLKSQVKEVIAIDNNESELFYLNERYRKEPRYQGFFADIRELDRLRYLFKQIDVVIHLAALKHVIISEQSPFDAVKTNAEGTLNVIHAALDSPSVDRVIYTSSDKAVNSTNVMGTTKLLGERLMTSAANLKAHRNIIFCSTRFGNVLGSRGSIVPIWYEQIKNGKSLTITDERMTRFFMTATEAVNLVLEASFLAKGGEVFVTKMPVMRITDLAAAMVNLLAPKFNREPGSVDIEFIGPKPGEKLFEELMTEEETSRAYELSNMFMIKPPTASALENMDYPGIISKTVNKPYISSGEPFLSVAEIKSYLLKQRIFPELSVTDFHENNLESTLI